MSVSASPGPSSRPCLGSKVGIDVERGGVGLLGALLGVAAGGGAGAVVLQAGGAGSAALPAGWLAGAGSEAGHGLKRVLGGR